MLDKEGTQKPEDYVLVGSEDAIIEQLSQYKAAGVTDCGIQISPSPRRDRAMKLISTLPKFLLEEFNAPQQLPGCKNCRTRANITKKAPNISIKGRFVLERTSFQKLRPESSL